MSNTRNGKIAKAKRRQAAADRAKANQQYFEKYDNMTFEERQIHAIFGAWEECLECHNQKLVGTDCQTPHCKSLRGETSLYYDEVTEDHIIVNGVHMYAGVDY